MSRVLLLLAASVIAAGCDKTGPERWKSMAGQPRGEQQLQMDAAACRNQARLIIAASAAATFGEAYGDCMMARGWQFMGRDD